MEVIEDGNIMDRIPILLQRDFEYYQVSIIFFISIMAMGVSDVRDC